MLLLLEAMLRVQVVIYKDIVYDGFYTAVLILFIVLKNNNNVFTIKIIIPCKTSNFRGL